MSAPLSGLARLADSRLAVVAVPAGAIVVALRRRARRRASSQAWRYRTHHEASADSARIVSSHYQDGLEAARSRLDEKASIPPEPED